MPPLAAPEFDFERWFDNNGVRVIAIVVVAMVVTIVTDSWTGGSVESSRASRA